MKNNLPLPQISELSGNREFDEKIRIYLRDLQKEVFNQSSVFLPPIGFIYFQLPGKEAPEDIFSGGTWTNVSSTFAGVFFRAEGGDASTFESGNQAQSTKLPTSSFTTGNQSASHSHTAGNQSASHSHTATVGNQSASHTHTGTSGNASADHDHDIQGGSHYHGNGARFYAGGVNEEELGWRGIQSVTNSNGQQLSATASSYDRSSEGLTQTSSSHDHTMESTGSAHTHTTTTGNQSASHNHTVTNGNQSASHTHTLGNQDTSHSHTVTGGGDSETRPVNVTIRIWERTA